MSPLRGCTVIVLSGPGSRSRQLQIPHGWPLWMCLISMLSVGASLFAGRQARAWFDPRAHRPGMQVPQPKPVIVPAPQEALVVAPAPRKRRARTVATEQALPSAIVKQASVTSREPKRERERAEARGQANLLKLFDVNAGAALSVQPFDAHGLPDNAAFDQLKEFMRCRRTGLAHDMNPNLVALLASISGHFDGAVLHVISGHRAADDVATRPSSQHTRGTAADIRIPGVSIETLAAVAHELGAKGVGVYPLSRFVHVDVRAQPYYWRDVGTGPVATRAPF